MCGGELAAVQCQKQRSKLLIRPVGLMAQVPHSVIQLRWDLGSAILKARWQLQGGDALFLGGAKANFGHAEPAAGLAGLLKLLACLEARQAVSNAQLRLLSLHLQHVLDEKQCLLPEQVTAKPHEMLLGGVSLFGYSGTIAHSILRYVNIKSMGTHPSLVPYSRDDISLGDTR